MLNQEIKEKLEKIAGDNHTSLFVVLFSTYLFWLSYFSKQGTVTCSIISAGRNHPSLHDVIGFFVNPILLTINIEKEESFSQLLRRIHEEMMSIFKFQSYPLELVFEDLNMQYPDVPVSFNMINIREGSRELELAPYEPYHLSETQDIKFDIEPYVAEYKNGIDISWKYRESRFQAENIAFLTGEYKKMLDFFSKDPQKKLNDYAARTAKRSLSFKKKR